MSKCSSVGFKLLAACNVLFSIPSLSNTAFQEEVTMGLCFLTAFCVMKKHIATPWPFRCCFSDSSKFHRTASLKLILTCTA